METVIYIKNATICQMNIPVLEDVNFEINAGDFVYLTGKTGSGKSSLLKTLYAELPLETGEGIVVDTNLVKLKQNKIPFLRRQLGVVFQDFQLLTDRNINDNLAFVLKATGWNKNDMQARIDEVLNYVGMKEVSHKKPFQLSGGEQQRIAIARALLNNPKVIIADEPTGNLDPETSDMLMQLLHNIASQGTAVIMATHNYSLIDKYDGRVFRCEDKSLIEMSFRN